MLSNPPNPPMAQPAGEPVALSWQHPRGLLGLSFVNFFLRLITLGIYGFWGKTEVRRRLWSAVRLNGEPLAYGGTGLELFLGFLVALLYFVIPYAVLIGTQIYAGPQSPWVAVVGFVFYILITWLLGIALFRARRYRLSRTTWRGIRGTMAGSATSFAWTYLWTGFLVVISLGWAAPWRSTKLQRMLVEATRFGQSPLTFTATSGRLYWPFTVLWVGGIISYVALIGAIAWMAQSGQLGPIQGGGQPIPSPQAIGMFVLLGLAWFVFIWLVASWYSVRSFNHYSNHTKFEGASFSGDASAGGLIWLGLTNFFIQLIPMLIVLGIAGVIGAALGLFQPPAGTTAAGGQIAMQARIVSLFSIVPFLILVSLGILAPIIQARSTRFWLRHLNLTGTVSLASIKQSADAATGLGEGLAQAFDIDVL